MGCCRANFAFLHASIIGTFCGKWTLEWLFKTSHFAHLALYFFNPWSNCFCFAYFSTMPGRKCKNMFRLERKTVQKINFPLHVWKPIYLEVCSFPVPFSITTHEHSKKKTRFSTICEHREWGLNKTLGGCRVKSWPNVASKQLQSRK